MTDLPCVAVAVDHDRRPALVAHECVPPTFLFGAFVPADVPVEVPGLGLGFAVSSGWSGSLLEVLG